MKPRRLRLAKRKTSKPKRARKKFLLSALVLSILAIFLYLVFSPRVWDGKSRLSIAVAGEAETQVVTLDPSTSSITKIHIPNTTEVNAANNMGKWKLGSIWKLGENEDLDPGKFLSMTIMKSFGFPIEAWDGGSQTNLTLRDKINIAVFKANVKNAGVTEIKLEETGYINPVKLTDGSKGFAVKERMPVKLLSIFADSEIARKNINVKIINRAGDRLISDTVSKIVEVIGLKVTSTSRLDPDDTDCVVKGRDQEVNEKIAKLFDCRQESGQADGGIEITIGKKFLKRF